MCGIGGVVGGGPTPLAVLERMACEMAHRGPDGQGTWSEETAGLAFRRLAIIDLDERSNQPMHLGALHLVFNGEIYNYIELRAELRGLGHAFHTEGDAEVLLHAWAQWGEGALDRFNGMFAFAIWDAAAAVLTLATDPFAEKPLFYHRRGERLTFASDVRALRAADPSIGIPDERALGDYVALAMMPALPATFFADVQRLPGAHLARFRDGSLELHRYWSPVQIDVPATPQEAATALGELLSDSVRLRLRSDVPVGTSLSGGIDSSAIVSRCAQIAGDHRRHAFTAAFDGFARDEWRYASQVASGAGVVLAVRVVSSGPLGPPIPGGGSSTRRLNPRNNPPPCARVMSVCAIRGRYRSTSISKLFSSASAIASANERYNWPACISSKIRSEF